jgi:hypothetical protein
MDAISWPRITGRLHRGADLTPAQYKGGRVSVPGPICMGGVSVPLRPVGLGTGPVSDGGGCFALCAADLNAGAFAAGDARPAASNGAFLAENS